MRVPLVDLKAQYIALKSEIDEAISRVLSRAFFVQGDDVAIFEREFADFCGVERAVAVASGTDALHLALRACEIGSGDEVITTPLNFVSAVEAIFHVGAKPVFIDIDPEIGTIDPEKIEDAITGKTKAILPAHLYGYPADIDRILEIAEAHNLKVIEDSAQGHGGMYKGQHIGTFGHAGCFSFHPSNNLGAFGDAGIVVTNYSHTADRIRLLRNHGKKAEEHLFVGFNSKMDTLQAAVLRVKLSRLREWNERRKSIANKYRRLLCGQELRLPLERADVDPSYYQFVVRTPNRGQLRRVLNSVGIDARSDIRLPIHLQPAYRYLGYQLGDFPAAEQISREIISLPIYPELTDEQVHEIARCFNQAAPESYLFYSRKTNGKCEEVVEESLYF
jgi:dTDP-4-amino-4,6-dideoxygalactose transaminase